MQAEIFGEAVELARAKSGFRTRSYRTRMGGNAVCIALGVARSYIANVPARSADWVDKRTVAKLDPLLTR